MTQKLSTPRDKVEYFLSTTADDRYLSQVCRDYHDHKQWTAAQEAKLRARKQAPIVVNRVRPKVEGLVGLYNLRKVDPKAYPRTRKHENSAHAVTDALRYVIDNTDFDTGVRLDVAEDFFVEGYAGAFVDVKPNKQGEPEIVIDRIPFDRIVFDPHSRRRDFSDARWKGMLQWLYRDQFEELFPEADWEQAIQSFNNEDEITEDKPKWAEKGSERILVCLKFYIEKGEWKMCLFSGDYEIIKKQKSPYLDEDGDPCCPIELVSANINRSGGRYGEVLGWLSQQDEINHRRSKFLHYLNARTTWSRPGVFKDKARLKTEMSKPDGHVDIEGQFGQDWGFVENPTAESGQFNLYQDAKAELDAVSFNAQLSGERQQGDLSGKAIDRLQQAGTIELNRKYALLVGWEKRIYRQIWGRIKQAWTSEKWIRVTDDQDTLRWVGLNAQVTAQDYLEQTANDESLPIDQRRAAAASLQFLTQTQDPRLQQVLEVKNPVPDLDMDIILDQSFDVTNVQQEQFQLLAQFAQGQDIDVIELIELSEIRNKEALIDRIQQRRAAAQQATQGSAQLEQAEKVADINKKNADAEKSKQEAVQKGVETHLMTTQPDRISSISV